jgi:hypothetical protein
MPSLFNVLIWVTKHGPASMIVTWKQHCVLTKDLGHAKFFFQLALLNIAQFLLIVLFFETVGMEGSRIISETV